MWQFVIGLMFMNAYTHGNPDMSGPGVFFLCWAMLRLYRFLKKPPVPKAVVCSVSADRDGYSGRTVYDNTRYFYDDNNNFIDIEDGSFTEGLDGRYRDDAGHVVERDWDGELRLVEDRRYGGR